MTIPDSSLYDMSPLKLALAGRQMEGNLVLMRAEPIAVTGMGCRFPGGGNSPEAYWQMLLNGVDAVGPIPPGRWDVDHYYDPDPGAPGKMYCRHGSFIDAIDGFDARLFGISPREAASMDPQQRVLLETAWAAIHDAGLDREKLYGSPTGVYLGISTSDYAALQLALGSPARIDPYYVSGTVLSVAAGRLSYALGLKGPSMALDTACSSSLVAVHQACEALRRRECNLALTGGVGLIMAPEPGISFCKAGLLSPDGRCKTFDDAADGYGRGEGCGVLVLKRLGDALADGDTVLALIRGSAINQDGASGGLTVPSGPSQEAVIRTALANCGLDPGQVGYIEAHGTGTSLGDPIEMGVLGKVFGTPERSSPLWVGSVKTNFGHLEAASGVAGMIKLVLSFQHRKIPEHLHFNTPSKQIDWDRCPVQIPGQVMDWPAVSGSMVAGVSSFGFCGTNAHVVMEGFDGGRAGEEKPVTPVTFSRQRYWVDTSSPEPLLAKPVLLPGKPVNLPLSSEIRFECPMGEKQLAHLPDHRLFGHLVVAGASHLSMVVEAVATAFGPVAFTLKEISLEAPLVVPENEERLAQLIFSPMDEDNYRFKLVSAPAATCPDLPVSCDWSVHAQGELSIEKEAPGLHPIESLSIDPGRFDGADGLSGSQLYDEITALGHHLGPSFRWVEKAQWRDGEILSRMTVPDGLEDPYRFHPGLLDSSVQCFCIHGPQMVAAGAGNSEGEDAIFVPFAFETVRVPAPCEKASGPLYSRVRIQSRQVTRGSGLCADLVLCDAAGKVLAEFTGFTVRLLSAPVLKLALETKDAPETYRVDWVPEPLAQDQTAGSEMSLGLQKESIDQKASLNWLILADQKGLGRKIAVFLEAYEHNVTLAFAGQGTDGVRLSHGTTSTLTELVTDRIQPFDRILYLWGLDIRSPGEPDGFTPCYEQGCLSPMHLVQLMAAVENDPLPQLTLVTRTGWTGETGKDGDGSPFQAMLWGMGRVISIEHPSLGCTLVDWLDEVVTLSQINRLINSRNGDELTFAEGKCLIPRLCPFVSADKKVAISPDKTYLITGGGGALGMAVAERLAGRGAGRFFAERGLPGEAVQGKINGLKETGAKHLVLVGRGQPGEAVQRKIEDLKAMGKNVRFVAGNVGNADDLGRILALIENEMPHLGGVVHAAGLVDDGLLIHQDPDRMTRVLVPKVAGAWNLHCLTRGSDLDFMVFFSSMTSLLGTAGQAGYGAANGFMDGLAHFRKQGGLPCLSINWGGWAGLGMAAGLNPKERDRLKASGIGLIEADKGLDILEQLLTFDGPQAAVLNMVWDRYAGRYGGGGPPAMIAELISGASLKKNRETDNIVNQLKALPLNAREQALMDYLWGKVTRILGFPEDTPLDGEAGLFDLGMDSIMAVQLKDQLADEFNRPIRSTLVFNHPSIGDIAGYLKDKILPALFGGSGETKTSDETGVAMVEPLKKERSVRDITDDDLDGLSEDTLGDMLDEKLAKLNKWL
jgi:3-oxoacyl-(acyl-carrier-protein) synthase/NAD(P)-dependent dehydrogenase (short-subunit alcohol dehydrogenase family)/acyl carrier protein